MLNAALKRLTLAVSVTLAVSGCTTLGPDFKAPANVADASFRHQPQGAASEAHLPAQWKRLIRFLTTHLWMAYRTLLSSTCPLILRAGWLSYLQNIANWWLKKQKMKWLLRVMR